MLHFYQTDSTVQCSFPAAESKIGEFSAVTNVYSLYVAFKYQAPGLVKRKLVSYKIDCF